MPWILVRALICERFSLPPSVFNEQEADEMLRMWLSLLKYEEYAHRK